MVRLAHRADSTYRSGGRIPELGSGGTPGKQMNEGNYIGERLPLFIEGYFTQRFQDGNLPDYRCPKSRLPEIAAAETDIVTLLS